MFNSLAMFGIQANAKQYVTQKPAKPIFLSRPRFTSELDKFFTVKREPYRGSHLTIKVFLTPLYPFLVFEFFLKIKLGNCSREVTPICSDLTSNCNQNAK